jgi:hypothetical protein
VTSSGGFESGPSVPSPPNMKRSGGDPVHWIISGVSIGNVFISAETPDDPNIGCSANARSTSGIVEESWDPEF